MILGVLSEFEGPIGHQSEVVKIWTEWKVGLYYTQQIFVCTCTYSTLGRMGSCPADSGYNTYKLDNHI